MGEIAIDNLIAGMVLAANVRDRNSRLLLKAGTELIDKNLYILRTWGTVEAEVVGTDGNQEGSAGAGSIDLEILSGIEAELTPQFRYTDLSHPAMKELLRVRIVQEARHEDR
jgi:hypothetical protein